MQVRAIGIPWYRREDYPRLLALFADAAALPRTWDEWHQRAEQLRGELEARGAIAERVMLDPDEFAGWCVLRGLRIDNDARKRFAAEAVAAKHRNRS